MRCMGSLPAKARAGRGRPAKVYGYPCEGAGGVGDAGRRIWVSSCEGAGGVGVPMRCMGSLPAKARVGWGLPARYTGILLRRRGRGGGCRQKRVGSLPAGGAGKGCRREVRWLECGRQGRGNKFPLPASLSPRGDIHTVHSMGRSWRRAGYGFLPAIPRIRLLP